MNVGPNVWTLEWWVALLKHYGFGPWPCYFCNDPVFPWGVEKKKPQIHHVDEDRSNNDVSNLVFAHRFCHNSHHHSKPITNPVTLSRMSAASKLRRHSPETKAKIGAGQLGRTHSPEARARMSESRKRVIAREQANA